MKKFHENPIPCNVIHQTKKYVYISVIVQVELFSMNCKRFKKFSVMAIAGSDLTKVVRKMKTFFDLVVMV